MFCMKCKDARSVFRTEIHITQKSRFLSVEGICRTCKTSMFKSYKLSDFPTLKRQFSLVDISQLYDLSNPTDKTQIQPHKKTTFSESIQGDLF